MNSSFSVEPVTWQDIDAFIEKWAKYDLSFSVEYSDVVDWLADFTPRRFVEHARDYEFWREQAGNRDIALRRAMKRVEIALTEVESGGGGVNDLVE